MCILTDYKLSSFQSLHGFWFQNLLNLNVLKKIRVLGLVCIWSESAGGGVQIGQASFKKQTCFKILLMTDF